MLDEGINDPYDNGGGPGPGSGPGANNNGGGSIDARQMAMALNLAGQTYISQYGLSLSSAELFAIIGFDGYNYDFSDGFIDAEVNEDFALRKIVEFFKNKIYSASDIVASKSPYGQMNNCERPLVWGNPTCASTIAGNYGIANLMTHHVFGYNIANECSDAFRHAYFNAMNAAACGVELAKDFGDARECTSDTDLAKEMDLFNNQVGYILLLNVSIKNDLQSLNPVRYFLGLTSLRSAVCSKLSNGDLKVFDDPSAEDPDSGGASLISSSNCSCY